MKACFAMFAILFVLASGLPAQGQSDKSDRIQKEKPAISVVQYACPMHPEVTGDKPGKCSKCSMDLALSKKEQMKTAAMQYSCPMHPEITSTSPGKCAECGMNLNLSKKEQMKSGLIRGFSCPMHTNVTADKPGKCSKCGMALTENRLKSRKA